MRRRTSILILLASLAVTPPAGASVANPDLSVIGQPSARWTEDAASTSRRRVTLDPGEVEVVLDAYLNPYATGTFVLSAGEEEAGVEEGYFHLLRGLPAGLALKGGRYRVGFGRISPTHPHALPFAERPGVLAAYLPGEEAFTETGVSLSGRVPLPGTFALTATADLLQGDSFRLPRSPSGASNDPLLAGDEASGRAGESLPAFVGALSGFGDIGERSGYELGLYAAGGTNDVVAGTRTVVLDLSARLKLWTGPSSYLLLQAEGLRLDREVAGWDSAAAAYANDRVRPAGAVVFADYVFNPRVDAGLLVERWQEPVPGSPWSRSVGAFAGLSLMEETTAFRLEWRRATRADAARAVDTVVLRVLFSMGPHRAHTF